MKSTQKILIVAIGAIIIIGLFVGIYQYCTPQNNQSTNPPSSNQTNPTPNDTTSPTPTVTANPPTATPKATTKPTHTVTTTPRPTAEPTLNVTVATVGNLPILGTSNFTWRMTISGFNQPTDVDLDSEGNIYVLDAGHQLVWKFNSSGNVITKWGSLGTGAGQFTLPNSIAVDDNGYVYVADTDRIEKFTLDGTYVTQWTDIWPTNIATDSSGNVYAALSGNCIKKFNSNGTLLMQIGSYGSGDDKFGQGPIDVTVDNNGTIYTLDYQNANLYEGKTEYLDTCVKVFAANGTFLYKFGSYGGATWDGLLNTSCALTVDKNGSIYVADTGNFRIQKFASNGTYLKQVGTYGASKLQFENPTGIAVDVDGCIYVSDMGVGSIQKIKG